MPDVLNNMMRETDEFDEEAQHIIYSFDEEERRRDGDRFRPGTIVLNGYVSYGMQGRKEGAKDHDRQETTKLILCPKFDSIGGGLRPGKVQINLKFSILSMG